MNIQSESLVNTIVQIESFRMNNIIIIVLAVHQMLYLNHVDVYFS